MSKTNTDRVVKRIELKATPARVWRALTDHEEFGQWFRVKLEGPFEEGEWTIGQITHPGYEHMKYEVLVETMETERLFTFRWHAQTLVPQAEKSDEPGMLVEFKLEPTTGGTLLTVIESGFDSIPDAYRLDAFRQIESGWTEQMKNIEAYLSDAS